MHKWQVPIRCRKCSDVIFSRYDGEYRACKCGAIAVDQTPYYARWIGDMHNFEEVKNETDDDGSTGR